MEKFPFHFENGLFPCVVWYQDDCENSGYGDNAKVNYWYGKTMQECVERSKLPAPKDGWTPLSIDAYCPDHATMTGMYDKY